MANPDTPFGLKPIRHRNGAPYNGAANPYYVNSSYATALFIGDPVIKVAGGSNATRIAASGAGTFEIGTLPEVEKATAGTTNRITGVIVGFAALPTNLEQKHSPASTEAVALVCDDPDVIFEIQADGAIPAASMGLNAVLIYTHAGSTTTGLSGVELDTTSDAPAATAADQLLILRAANREDNDTTLTHAKVEVLINQHTQNQGTVGTLGI
ncbi:MAG: hypothetical protein OEU09_24730 [Rhodospirillales bacterium]|nr:hypothetical protein [Rhodospirillales bacterium]